MPIGILQDIFNGDQGTPGGRSRRENRGSNNQPETDQLSGGAQRRFRREKKNSDVNVIPDSTSQEQDISLTLDPGEPSSDIEPQDRNRASVDYSSSGPGDNTPGDPNTEGRRGKKPNVLSQFASYSVITTLAALSKVELSDPDNTYRLNGPQNVILRSGGTGNNQVKTSYEQELGITLEYYIDNLEINTIIAPTPLTTQTNATTFSFQVIEPYSMGLFLETLANSVQSDIANDKPNYASQPYLLMLEFIGFDNNGEPVQTGIKRYIPLRFSKVEFNVNAGGSVYDVQAYAYSEYAFADEIQVIPQDIKLTGSSVAEALQIGSRSLTSTLNRLELNYKDNGNKQSANAYIIMFPDERSSADEDYKGSISDPVGATSVPPQIGASIKAVSDNGLNLDALQSYANNEGNINEIGRSSLSDEIFDNGTRPHRDTAEVDDPKQNTAVETGSSLINIRKGKRIQDIIEEFVLASEYGKKLAESEPDAKGMKPYFRIEPEVYEIVDPANEKQRGSAAKIYVYRVVEYKVHAGHFVSPSQTSPGISYLRKSIPKEYQYIYTGKNDDIIDFDITFNTAFYQALQFDLFQAGQDQLDSGASGRANVSNSTPGVAGATDRVDQENENGGEVQGAAETRTTAALLGGNLYESPATRISRQFNDAIVNGVDLIQAEMEIWGDPYYINDSGLGNYRAARAENQETENGAIDYQYGEAFIILNFVTPLDIDQESGIIQFPTAAGEPVRKFSGVYRITEVTNEISGNKFTQRLKMIRMRNQYGEETSTTSVVEPSSEPLSEIIENALSARELAENEILQSPVPAQPQSNIQQEEATGTGATIPGSSTSFISP